MEGKSCGPAKNGCACLGCGIGAVSVEDGSQGGRATLSVATDPVHASDLPSSNAEHGISPVASDNIKCQ